jgi:phosphoribosylformylglycinamidine synthase
MIFEIAIKMKKGFSNPHTTHLVGDIDGIGVKGIKSVEYMPVYRIDSDITVKQAETIASELLSDKITEEFGINKYNSLNDKKIEKHSIEVWFKSGVTDTVSESVVKAIKDLGISNTVAVKTGHKYLLNGDIDDKKLTKIATGLLANTLIQEYKIK